MKKLFSIQGLLVMAVALTMGLASCSSDSDDKTAESEQIVSKQVDSSTIFVSIGAGVAENGTRSEATYADGKYKLKFTSGDKLYVRAEIGSTGKIVAGELSTKEGEFDNTTGPKPVATFKGYLTIYDSNDSYKKSTYDGFSTNDPFNECVNHTAWLIPDTKNDTYTEFFKVKDDKTIDYIINGTFFANTVNELMESNLMVKSKDYNTTYSNQFALVAQAGQPIFNCTFKGLEKDDYIMVNYLNGSSSTSYDYNSRRGYFTADASGEVKFAFYGKSTNNYHKIRLVKSHSNTSYNYLDIDLGPQKLENNTVYNVGKTVSSGWNSVTRPKTDPSLTEGDYSSNVANITNGSFTITGMSVNSYFTLADQSSYTVNLDPDDAIVPLIICYSNDQPFISADNNLTVNLKGDNFIYGNQSSGEVIEATGTLKLTVESGKSYTLSILVPVDKKGLSGSNYKNGVGSVSGLAGTSCEVEMTTEPIGEDYVVYNYKVTHN